MVRLDLSFFFFFEKEHICKVPFSSCHMKRVCHQSDLSLLMLISITLLKKWLTDFTNVKCCFLYPFLYCIVWSEVTFGQPILEGGELFSISLRTKYLHRLFGIFFVGDLSVCLYIVNYFTLHLLPKLLQIWPLETLSVCCYVHLRCPNPPFLSLLALPYPLTL